MKDTDLVPLQRALSGAGRRVSRSSGTIPLGHILIFEVGSFVKRLKKKGIIKDMWACACAEQGLPPQTAVKSTVMG